MSMEKIGALFALDLRLHWRRIASLYAIILVAPFIAAAPVQLIPIEGAAGLIASLLLFALPMTMGTSLVATERDKGTLSLLLTLPMTRRTLFIAKASEAAILCGAAVALAMLSLGTANTIELWRYSNALVAVFIASVAIAVIVSSALFVASAQRVFMLFYMLGILLAVSLSRLHLGPALLIQKGGVWVVLGSLVLAAIIVVGVSGHLFETRKTIS